MLNISIWMTILFSSSLLYGVQLNFPENEKTLNYIIIYFDWTQEADAVEYNIQLSMDNHFDEIIFDITQDRTIYIGVNELSWSSTYFWRVRSIYPGGLYGDWSQVSSFHTGAQSGMVLNTTVYDESAIDEKFTMIGRYYQENRHYVINNNQSEIWNSISNNDSIIFLTSVDKYGRLFGVFDVLGEKKGVKYNFDNDILWMSNIPVNSHEFIQVSDKNYFGLTSVYEYGPIALGEWTEDFNNLGYIADGQTNEFLWKGIAISEFDKNTNEEVWTWNPFEHFSTNDFDKYGATWWEALINGYYDWMHTNSLDFDEEEQAIYISIRHLSRISKISYPSGDVMWNMGLPQEYGTGTDNICNELLFSFQHHVQLINGDELIFFDNGNLSNQLLGYGPISRGLKIKVFDGDNCQVLWDYSLPSDLYGYALGSIQQLDNGSYSIYSYGSDGPGGNIGRYPTILEVTESGDLIKKVQHASGSDAVYRTFKIPSIHPQAFSVYFDNYTNIQNSDFDTTGILINEQDLLLSFKIYNGSGYNQPYKYIVTDSSGWLTAQSDSIHIDTYNDTSITLNLDINSQKTVMMMQVWPVFHPYNTKSIRHNIFYENDELSLLRSEKEKIREIKNVPNPFNSSVTLKYHLNNDTMVNITIYDMVGRVVKTLVKSSQTAGFKSIQWNATNDRNEPVSAGLYLYTIQAGEFRQTKKMVLLK